MGTLRCLLLAATLLYAGSSAAEKVQLPLDDKAAGKNGLWSALVVSLSSGSAVLFPMEGPNNAPMMFQVNTPGQPADNANESFRVVRKMGGDERAEVVQLTQELSRMCKSFPAHAVKMPNGAVLVERESWDCVQPGYRLTISRFMQGADGSMYQAVYLARHERPTDASIASWRTRLAEAKLVP